ncbi:hypothetical protein VTK56DRAFT_4024 [Thermocarpiscus australiensis]
MNEDRILDLYNLGQSFVWFRKVGECRDALPTWVSRFHPEKMPCRLRYADRKHDLRGSYNLTIQFVFENLEEWLVRFPIGPKVRHADEKVEAEVMTLKLLRERTDIPVPEVRAWGLAADNEFGIGPFIIMSVIQGVKLETILDPDDNTLRADLAPGVLESIYRQIARFMLQLSSLDFPRIGSLSKTSLTEMADPAYAAAINSRPFTWRSHETLVLGGVDTYCPKATTFSSTADYYAYVAEADLRQLHQQPSAVDDDTDAREKLVHLEVFKAITPRHVVDKYNNGPFKFMCDDFGPANMIVNNERDLKIVGVIDWEFSWAAPVELFWSPPRWLLLRAPNYWFDDESDREIEARYHRNLNLSINILEEEEDKDIPLDERPSTIMRNCRDDARGRMWFHAVIRQGFNGPGMLVWRRLREATPDFEKLAAAIPESRIREFVQTKMEALAEYEKKLAKEKAWWDRALAVGGNK